MYGCSEQAIANVRAVVMTYDDARAWVEVGPSKVSIYHHPVQNTYRVVARKTPSNEVSSHLV